MLSIYAFSKGIEVIVRVSEILVPLLLFVISLPLLLCKGDETRLPIACLLGYWLENDFKRDTSSSLFFLRKR
jgi:hypothetical protein